MSARAASPRRHFLRGSLALALGLPTTGLRAAEAERTTRHGMAFGTRVSVTIAGMSPAQAAVAADAAMAEIVAVEAAVGLHAATSALARLNREGRVDADPHLHALLVQARHWSEATSGAFDVTVQPLWQRYFAAAVRGKLPTAAQVEQARVLVGWRDILVADDGIAFARPGMQATLNGLAQGYASDRAWQVLQAHGAEHALVDAGEPRVAGSSQGVAGGTPWRLGVRDPRGHGAAAALADVVELRDAALASSGDDAYRFTTDGRLHHILDPHSGRSPRELAGVTVLAPDACTADALSTACMVLGVARSLALVAALPGTEAVFIRKDGRIAASRGWPGRLRSA